MLNAVRQSQEQGPNGDAGGALDLAIVVLNYNTAELLRECLHSVYAGGGDLAYRVCVVDNASADNSAQMVRNSFPDAHLIANARNVGYAAGNNQALCWFGFDENASANRKSLPRYVLLLNPDTTLPPGALSQMVRFLDERPRAGVAGPRVRRLDGSLDRACRRSFPTPRVSLFRMAGLSRLFPRSRLFNAYNVEYLPEDAVHPVDSVVGAFMMVRREAILQAGLLDDDFFMYGEDLDWAKRIKDAGWKNWYNGRVEITHVKEASSQVNIKSRIDFYEAMWIFYRKHYRRNTSWFVDKLIRLGIAGKGGVDIAWHLWRYCGDAGRDEFSRRRADAARLGTLANDAPEA